ncbi:Hpt domain-containing response regulator [Lysobacter hankyongensis]|uniref:Response regulator n=1 Tax=Lysobacter hankyongensis TaxID=1176535 RepID=A0ABP9CE27_9GAMM
MNASVPLPSGPSQPAALPRVLLLEDDPVSAAFLAEGIAGLPATVEIAGTVAEARTLAGDRHALWLFDANLPDGRGDALLAELRAGGLTVPALAHTADARREERDALIAAGFVEVLPKPLAIAHLHAALRRALGTQATWPMEDIAAPCSSIDGEPPPIWDDAVALRALNGQRAHVDTMRGLFRDELIQTVARVADAFARGDIDALHAELHRLQAACGFTGAARLAMAVDAMRATTDSSAAHAQFERAAQDTLSSPSG